MAADRARSRSPVQRSKDAASGFTSAYSSSASDRMDQVMRFFHEDVRVSRLATGTMVLSGKAKLKLAFEKQGTAASAVQTTWDLVMTSSDSQLYLHAYESGKSPGLGIRGLQAQALQKTALLALFRVKQGKIDHIWLSETPKDLAIEGSKEKIMASEVWQQVLEVAGDSGSAWDCVLADEKFCVA
mmetsp:Transcript_11425/g.20202  ORF Transcript_11425/g.20202 Transcript_11425/m.20202 type:complete len:185 (+) Transcript_11425:66-620(+)